MSNVLVRIQAGGPFSASIDLGKQLEFEKGSASEVIDPGRHHLIWFVFGEPGTPYTVDIAEPPEALFHLSTTITSTSGKEIGQHPFDVR